MKKCVENATVVSAKAAALKSSDTSKQAASFEKWKVSAKHTYIHAYICISGKCRWQTCETCKYIFILKCAFCQFDIYIYFFFFNNFADHFFACGCALKSIFIWFLLTVKVISWYCSHAVVPKIFRIDICTAKNRELACKIVFATFCTFQNEFIFYVKCNLSHNKMAKCAKSAKLCQKLLATL